MKRSLCFHVSTFSTVAIYEVMKESSPSANSHIAERFNLDDVIYFYKPKKGLSSPVFTIIILVAKTFCWYQADN